MYSAGGYGAIIGVQVTAPYPVGKRASRREIKSKTFSISAPVGIGPGVPVTLYYMLAECSQAEH